MRDLRLLVSIAVVAALWFAASIAKPPTALAQPSSVTLDGTALGPRFDGIGALTQGGQQRLLMDYPDAQRSQLLDLLFCSPFVQAKPGYCTSTSQGHYGAALQTLKVEIGGDGFEAEGAEPSIAHTQAELTGPCNYRGYEWWLMEQAKDRDPDIRLQALPWGEPGWLGPTRQSLYSSPEGVPYVVRFLQCAKQAGLAITDVGVLNEDGSASAGSADLSAQVDYIKKLKQALQNATNPTLSDTKIECCDLGYEPYRQLMDTAARGGSNDTALRNAVSELGAHYPEGPLSTDETAFSSEFNKPLWATEESVSGDLAFANPPASTGLIGEWYGGLMLAQVLNEEWNQGVTLDDLIFYLDGFYDGLYAPGAGFIQANTPWSGYYAVQPALWTVAQYTQFAAPGWRFLTGQGSGCLNPTDCSQGRYSTLTSGSGDWSLVANTRNASQPYTLSFNVTGGLSTGTAEVWRSDASGQMVQLDPVQINGGTFSYTFAPNAVYTITTLTGRGKLTPPSPPSTRATFPPDYSENFDEYQVGDSDPASAARDIPKYISTMDGSFELATAAQCGDGSQCLMQEAPSPATGQFVTPDQPYAMFGNRNWTNYDVTAQVAFPATDGPTAAASVQGRFEDVVNQGLDFQRHGSYEFSVQKDGDWQLIRHYVAQDITAHQDVLAHGSVPALGTTWHSLRIGFQGHRITASVDGQSVLDLVDTSQRALSSGMAGLGSSWDVVKFDDVSVEQLPRNPVTDDSATGTGNSQFNYAGNWKSAQIVLPHGHAYSNTVTATNDASASATFKFTGAGVILYGMTAQNGGFANVSVLGADGTTVVVPSQKIDFYHQAFAQGNQVVYASPPLPPGTYNLKVQPLGTGQPGQVPNATFGGLNYTYLDRAAVVPAAPGLPVTQAVQLTASQGALSQGSSAKVTLNLTSYLSDTVTVPYTVNPPAGVQVTPTQGSITVPPGVSQTSFTITVNSPSPGNVYRVPITFGSFTDNGNAYTLPGTQLEVSAPVGSLAAAYDNVATCDESDVAPCDIAPGNGFSRQALAAVGLSPGQVFVAGGASFTWPSSAVGEADNVMTAGQAITLSGQGTKLGFVATSDFGGASGTGTIIYSDGTTQNYTLSFPDWFNGTAGGAGVQVVATTPYIVGSGYPGGRHDVTAGIYYASVPLDPNKTVQTVILPDTGDNPGAATIHLFAMKVQGSGPVGSLAAAYNNVATCDETNVGPCDLAPGNGFSRQALAAAGLSPGQQFTFDGVSFNWPNSAVGAADNVMTAGQTITLSGQGTKLGFVATSDFGGASGTGTIIYSDGTAQNYTLSFPDWFNGTAAGAGVQVVATTPYIVGSGYPGGRANVTAGIYYASVPLDPNKTVQTVILPNTGDNPGAATIHLFAMSIG